jgi:hypothetical protein
MTYFVLKEVIFVTYLFPFLFPYVQFLLSVQCLRKKDSFQYPLSPLGCSAASMDRLMDEDMEGLLLLRAIG